MFSECMVPAKTGRESSLRYNEVRRGGGNSDPAGLSSHCHKFAMSE
jgi:hypothetical protein